MEISKEFQFEAAHRILGHSGKCARLHGHTYRLGVTVAAARLDALDMVMDFDDLLPIVGEAVLDRWDHATLLRRDDPLVPAIARVQAAAPDRLVLFAENPTVEVLAREAFDAIAKRLPDSVTLANVTVWETPTCSSRFSRSHAG
jgi:6-pyruvoyltetrahydropterin/6-carboxytetrahydropterin synthase